MATQAPAMIIDLQGNERPQWTHALESVLRTAPTAPAGVQVAWHEDVAPVAVELAKFLLSSAHGERSCTLFGVRRSFAFTAPDWIGDREGYLLEFVVVDATQGSERVHRLQQHGSITFSSSARTEQRLDAVALGKLEPDERHFAIIPPVWRVAETAYWPTHAAHPMVFVGQVVLEETAVNRDHLSWDMDVLLFQARSDSEWTFKVVTRDLKVQTADEHYRGEQAEARRARRRRRG